MTGQITLTNIAGTLSADGRYLVFGSYSDNLVAKDTNGVADIYVFDRFTKRTMRVSVASNGTQANHESVYASISADGRYVAFESAASNLVKDDTNHAIGIFVHNRRTKQTTRINIPSDSTQISLGSSSPILSADGRYVVFIYTAKPKGTSVDFSRFAYLHDRQTHKTIRIDSDASDDAWTKSVDPSISADGRYVAYANAGFHSDAQSDFTAPWRIYIYDRVTNRSLPIFDEATQTHPNLSADGRFMSLWTDSGYVYMLDRLLDKIRHADLKITSKQQPWHLAANGFGFYHFVITNNGPDAVNNVKITHVVSNGPKLFAIIPSQGNCNRYATISLCQLGKLLPGERVDIFTIAKAERNPLIQRMFVSGEPVDTLPGNNRVYIETKVTP